MREGFEQRAIDRRREGRVGVELGSQRLAVEEQQLRRDERDDRRGRSMRRDDRRPADDVAGLDGEDRRRAALGHAEAQRDATAGDDAQRRASGRPRAGSRRRLRSVARRTCGSSLAHGASSGRRRAEPGVAERRWDLTRGAWLTSLRLHRRERRLRRPACRSARMRRPDDRSEPGFGSASACAQVLSRTGGRTPRPRSRPSPRPARRPTGRDQRSRRVHDPVVGRGEQRHRPVRAEQQAVRPEHAPAPGRRTARGRRSSSAAQSASVTRPDSLQATFGSAENSSEPLGPRRHRAARGSAAWRGGR